MVHFQVLTGVISIGTSAYVDPVKKLELLYLCVDAERTAQSTSYTFNNKRISTIRNNDNQLETVTKITLTLKVNCLTLWLYHQMSCQMAVVIWGFSWIGWW